MATIESVLALRDQITPTLTGASAAAKQMTETMEKMQDIVVDELVTPSGVYSLDNASQAAKAATDNMARLQAAATNDLVGLDEVNRMELIAKQASLMESKWINQQMLVAKLSSEYDRAVNLFGRGSAEAEKLDAALFQAQLQENRLAMQALKAAESIQNQESSAQNVAKSINKQFMEVQKMWLNQQKIETAVQQTALAEQRVLKEAERITTEKHRQEQMQRKIGTTVQQTAMTEQRVLREAEKINTEKLRQERLQQQISQGQASFNQAAQQSRFQLFNVYAALQLIRTAVGGITKTLTWADEYSGISARLNLINDGLMTQNQLQSEIYKSAQDTRSIYTDTANLVTRIGMNANGLFDSNKSLVNFAGLTTKAMKVSGGSAAEVAQAITQLTQGMGTGVLKGQDFKSLLGNAGGQAFLGYVADGLDVSMGSLQQLASDGKLTAAAVAEAISKSTAKINQDFATLPVSFGDNMIRMKNTAMSWIDSLNQAGGPLDAINRKISQFTQWLESAGGHQFFQNITNGAVYAGMVITPIVDGIAIQSMNLMNMANDSGSQAFFQSLATYAQIAGDTIGWVVDMSGNLANGIIANWPMIEPIVMGIVGATAAYKASLIAVTIAKGALAIAECTHAAFTSATVAATTAATVAQMGLNASLLACPITWVVLGIITLIAAIVVATRWITKLWNTNDDFALGLLRTWNNVLGFVDAVPLFFARVWNGIATIFENGAAIALSIMENLNNGVISGINYLIEKLNSIPGVELAAVKKVSWIAENAVANEARQKGRAEDIAKIMSENEKKAAQREKDALAYIDNRAAERAEKASALEQENIKDALKAFQNDGSIGVNSNYGADINKVGSVGKIGSTVDISSEDLKYMRDMAEREAINQFTNNTIVPKLQVSFGDVRETADVEQIIKRIEELVSESLAISANGVHI